jgi:Sperm-tail PG-rich repeat
MTSYQKGVPSSLNKYISSLHFQASAESEGASPRKSHSQSASKHEESAPLTSCRSNNQASGSEYPGPGSYAIQSAHNPKVFSKKGYGVGFVSSEKKESFKMQKNMGPGPGYYVGKEGANEGEKRKKINFGPFLSSSQRMGEEKKQTKAEVGPGKYYPEQSVDGVDMAKEKARVRSKSPMFFANAGRSLQSPKNPVPGPGYYDVIKLKKRKNKTNSSFCFPKLQEKPTLKAFETEKVREKFGLCSTHSKPEPTLKILIDVPQGLSMFKQDNHDRFGRPLKQRPQANINLVGPGSYSPEKVLCSFQAEKSEKTNHFFTSKTKKGVVGLDKKTANIGPAKYKQNLAPIRKNYHRNDQNLWV